MWRSKADFQPIVWKKCRSIDYTLKTVGHPSIKLTSGGTGAVQLAGNTNLLPQITKRQNMYSLV